MSEKVEIFKLQIPLNTSEPTALALIYNEDRTIEYMPPVNEEIMRSMRGKNKRFIYGKLVKGVLQVNLDLDAPWQDW